MTRIIFELGINLFETFISVDFITKYLGAKWHGGKKHIAFIIAWMVLFAQITITNHITEFETVATYIPMTLYACYAFLCLKGSTGLKIWISILTQTVVMFVAIMTNVIFCNIIGYDSYKLITVFNSTRVIAVLIAKVIHYCTLKCLLRYKYKNPVDGQEMVIISTIPVISAASLAVMMKAVFIHSDISLYMILGMICILAANIMTYYFFTVMNTNYENKLKSKLLEQQNESLQQSIADDKAFVKKMKSLRHDINNHNIAIQAFFEKGDCKAGLEYMKNIGQQLNLTSDIIETGNIALDAIINAKKTVAQGKGIEFTTNIQIPENVFVNETDLCTVFGNALDNCIEACEQITDRERKISVSIVYDDNSLICKIANTAINTDNDLLTTTKQDKDNHGFGISNIKTALAKYNNVCRFKQSETEFILSFVIFNN